MILLDTCALIWSIFDTQKLSASARSAMIKHECAISIVTLWEMAIKVSLGKLTLTKTIAEIADMCTSRGISILPVTPEACAYLQQLPMIHKDPFDRMIIAQAITRDICLVTDDSNIRRYGEVETIW